MLQNLSLPCLACCVLLIGCADSTGDKLTADTPIRFELTAEQQTVVFITDRGWTGGMGDPVLDEKRRQIRVDGLRVVLSHDVMPMVESAVHIPDCTRNDKILVKALVHLEKRTERNGSIEGAPEETIYRLFVDELLDVVWDGESCD